MLRANTSAVLMGLLTWGLVIVSGNQSAALAANVDHASHKTSQSGDTPDADGKKIPLLYIPDWDFRWQNVYMYREPLKLPKGSRIDTWFRFDNSSGNPYNQHFPPKTIRRGWASDEEMCGLWMRFVSDDPKKRMWFSNAGNRSWRRPADVTEPPPVWTTQRPVSC